MAYPLHLPTAILWHVFLHPSYLLVFFMVARLFSRLLVHLPRLSIFAIIPIVFFMALRRYSNASPTVLTLLKMVCCHGKRQSLLLKE